MKKLKNFIIKEINILKEQAGEEQNFPIAPEIQTALEDKLKLFPLRRYVKQLKAANTLPPGYTVFLHNGQTFDIFYEDFSLMVKMEGREYYIADLSEREEAMEHINRLLSFRPVPSVIKPEDDEEMGDLEDDGMDDEGSAPPPPPPPAEEPEEPEEPAEEEPTV